MRLAEPRDRGAAVRSGTYRAAGDPAGPATPEPGPAGGTRGEGVYYDRSAGFRAMTTSIAFRWGTPLASEMNSTCPESKICQSQ